MCLGIGVGDVVFFVVFGQMSQLLFGMFFQFEEFFDCELFVVCVGQCQDYVSYLFSCGDCWMIYCYIGIYYFEVGCQFVDFLEGMDGIFFGGYFELVDEWFQGQLFVVDCGVVLFYYSEFVYCFVWYWDFFGCQLIMFGVIGICYFIWGVVLQCGQYYIGVSVQMMFCQCIESMCDGGECVKV